MNNKRRIFSLMFSLFLLLGSVPAWAVSLHSTWAASRFNKAGSTFQIMSPSATTFCYPTSISFEETDTGGEEATCRLTLGDVVWTLEAILDRTSDADVKCSAICYNN